jgi:hypothetical protein
MLAGPGDANARQPHKRCQKKPGKKRSAASCRKPSKKQVAKKRQGKQRRHGRDLNRNRGGAK